MPSKLNTYICKGCKYQFKQSLCTNICLQIHALRAFFILPLCTASLSTNRHFPRRKSFVPGTHNISVWYEPQTCFTSSLANFPAICIHITSQHTPTANTKRVLSSSMASNRLICWASRFHFFSIQKLRCCLCARPIQSRIAAFYIRNWIRKQ